MLITIDGHEVTLEMSEAETVDLIAKLASNLENSKTHYSGLATQRFSTLLNYDQRTTAGVLTVVTNLLLR